MGSSLCTRIITVVVVGMLFSVGFTCNVHAAATQIIIATGTYVVGDGEDENMRLAQERSKANAIRKAVQKAGLYVESYSKAEDMMITEDESRYVAGTVMNILEEEFIPEVVSDNIIRYSTRIKAEINIDGMFQLLRQKDRQEIEQNMQSYAALLERTKNLEEENEKIKQKYTALVWDNQIKQEMNNLLGKNESKFAANQMYIDSMKLLSQKQYQKALSLVNEALGKDGYEIGYVIRGNIHQELGQKAEAIADYTNAIRMNAYLGDAYKKRGGVYESQGNKEAAFKDYSQAISLGVKSYALYKKHGIILMERGEWSGALADFTKAYELNNQDNDLCGMMGRTYQMLGQSTEAVDMFSKSIKMGSNDHRIFYWRGNVLKAQGKYAQAVNDYRLAIELYPCREYYSARGDAYLKMGNKHDADIDYDVAKSMRK